MRRLFLSVAFVCFAVFNLLAVEVTLKMNALSQQIELKNNSTQEVVEVGEKSSSHVFTFEAEAGTYTLSAWQNNGEISNGTIQLTIPDEDTFAATLFTIYTGATNKDWVLGEDYQVEYQVISREGMPQVTTPGNHSTANRITFMAFSGNSYYVHFMPSDARKAEGYMAYDGMATVTANTSTTAAMPLGSTYSVVAPDEATVFIGKKLAHFTPFTEMLPYDTKKEGGTTTYYYQLANNTVYNFRASMENKLTHAGQFTMAETLPVMEFTPDMFDACSPKMIDRNPKSNGGVNVGDIFLNINEKGHLRMKQGESHVLLALRNWQLTDSYVNNYFMEPDFHVTVLGENGQPGTDVVRMENGKLKAVGNGTALVLVTYDAISVQSYRNNGWEPYLGGPLYSAIWPENTGVFVVTVGGNDPFITTNMRVNETLNSTAMKVAGAAVDAEHDVFYYLKETGGYAYTFKPEGAVTSVTLAKPVIGEQSLTYNGFSSEGVATHADGSYTVKLTEGRNIVKITSATGSEYQVFTAKPTTCEITNTSNPGEPIQPGDQITVQFSGLYHPANKLAGIYNMSAYLFYNGTPSGESLIMGPNQYTFSSSEQAQRVTLTIAEDWDTSKTFDLSQGVLQVNGFGDPIGNHRFISPQFGRSPNFTAISHKTYFGSIPDVSVKVHPTKYFEVRFAGMPEKGILKVMKQNKTEMIAEADGSYKLSFGTYTYEGVCEGYKMLRDTFHISSQSPEAQTRQISMEEAGENGWDGIAMTEPVRVTADESASTGGRFEGMEGFYKISKGAGLAWFAHAVNTSTAATKQNEYCAVLTNDIDLCGFPWTRIGNSTANYQYKGIFDGAGYNVKGLYIDATTNLQGLFGYIHAATIRNLTVDGEVKTTDNYAAGIVAYSTGASVIENCHNKATVSSKLYVGGVLGYMATGTEAVCNQVSNAGDITGTSNYIGGIAGRSDMAKISNAFNTGNITGNATSNIGGITGYATATGSVTNAYHAGTIVTHKETYSGGAIQGGSLGTLTNVYALGMGYADNATIQTTAAFASGEVAWLLGDAFGQRVGTDALPLLGGDNVYQVYYTDNLHTGVSMFYTNGTLPAEMPSYYVAWYTKKGGERITEVTEDAALYACLTRIEGEIVVNPFELTQHTLTLYPDQSVTLSLTAPQHFDVTWSSTNASVATVNEKGEVKSIAAGNTFIIAKDETEGRADTCLLTVKEVVAPAPADTVYLNSSLFSLTVRDTTTLIVTTSPGLTGKSVTWSSSDTSIATVAATGKVTAVGSGTCIITVAVGGFKATCIVVVAAAPSPAEEVAVDAIKENEASLSFPALSDASYYLVHLYQKRGNTLEAAYTLKVTPDGKVSLLRATTGSVITVPLGYLYAGTSYVTEIEAIREENGKAEVIHTEVTAFTTKGSPSGIEESSASQPKAWYADEVIHLENLEGYRVRLFNLNGVNVANCQVRSAYETYIKQLSTGVYILTAEKEGSRKTFKVVVR
ncbi:Ig-like domain-containing protein [Parabacteroides sp. OttesenSCG-928-K15]|nr:Ig-like domain-containing protein [Parabacteroides sp. OttesenSCG-928-K15]